MLRFAVLAVLFAAVCAIPINDESISLDHNVTVVDKHDESHLAENPEADVFELEDNYFDDYYRYTFGDEADGTCDNIFWDTLLMKLQMKKSFFITEIFLHMFSQTSYFHHKGPFPISTGARRNKNTNWLSTKKWGRFKCDIRRCLDCAGNSNDLMKMMKHSQVFFYLNSQSSDDGRVDIISGGIGQKQISFVIEARSVITFSYDVNIYTTD